MPDASQFQFASPLLDVRTQGAVPIMPIPGMERLSSPLYSPKSSSSIPLFPYQSSPIKSIPLHHSSSFVASSTSFLGFHYDEMGSEEEDESAADSDLGGNIGMECSDDDREGLGGPPEETPPTGTGKDGEMIEIYDKRELIAHEEDIDIEPYEGMEFDSEEDARAFYNAYANRTGFRVRVSRCQRSMRDGTIICRRFVCSKEGFYIQQNQPNRSKRHRMITRVGCMAMLVVKKQQNSGKWLVTKFTKEHNHEPVAPRKVDLKPRMVIEVNKVENCTEEERESPAETEKGLVVAATFPPQGSSELEPYEGMEFQSEEAARTFYYAYAKDMGFTVRISKCRRARDGSIICRRFVCSKEGYYVRKYESTKRSRALTRVGCLARLVVKKLDSDIWVVANFEKEHNHPPFVVGNELSYQPPKPMRRSNCGVRASLPATSCSMSGRDEVELQNSHNSVTWRFNMLHQEGIRFAEEGAASVEIFNVAMFALREATQKVVVAKKNAMAPQLGNLVSGSNQGDNANWASNFENQITLSNQQSSNEGKQAASPSGVMLVQQPVNLVLIAPGLPNESGKVPLAINLPNGQVLQGGPEKQKLSIMVPASVQKQISSAAHRLDGNGSLGLGMSAGRRRKHATPEDDKMNFIAIQDFSEGDPEQDGPVTQPQGWNILGVGQPGSNTESCGNSTGMALSEAQVAALQAVAEAFNVPTMGATSSSALPIKVSPVSDELSEGNEGYSLLRGSPCQSLEMSPHQSQDYPRTPPGPNPLVHAAAIAAGARIASPAVAASLIKAVQSRTAVHIRSGGCVMPKLPPAAASIGTESLAQPPGVHNQISNIHYFQTGEPSSPLVNVGVVPDVTLPGTHQVTAMATERGGMQSALLSEHTDVSNAKSEHGQMMYYSVIGESYTAAPQQHT